jgi:hypothetical protein
MSAIPAPSVSMLKNRLYRGAKRSKFLTLFDVLLQSLITPSCGCTSILVEAAKVYIYIYIYIYIHPEFNSPLHSLQVLF